MAYLFKNTIQSVFVLCLQQSLSPVSTSSSLSLTDGSLSSNANVSTANFTLTSPARAFSTSAEHYIIRVTMETDVTETDGNDEEFFFNSLLLLLKRCVFVKEKASLFFRLIFYKKFHFLFLFWCQKYVNIIFIFFPYVCPTCLYEQRKLKFLVFVFTVPT